MSKQGSTGHVSGRARIRRASRPARLEGACMFCLTGSRQASPASYEWIKLKEPRIPDGKGTVTMDAGSAPFHEDVRTCQRSGRVRPGRRTFCQSAMLLTSSRVRVWPQHSGGTSTPVTILPLKPVPDSRSVYACLKHSAVGFQVWSLWAAPPTPIMIMPQNPVPDSRSMYACSDREGPGLPIEWEHPVLISMRMEVVDL